MSNIILKDKTGTAKTYENIIAIKVPNTSSDYATYLEGGAKPEQTKTTDPSTSQVIVTPDSGYVLSQVTVNAMPSGSATTPATTITKNPTISWDSTNKKIKANYSESKSIIPTVSAGYVASGTAGIISTEGTTSVTAESLDENLIASNIKDGTTIFNMAGTFSDSSTITGTGKTAASASSILTGKSAFLDGAQIDGTMANNGATTGTIYTQGGTFTIPAGYHNGEGVITATLPSGTVNAPTAAKGTVSNNSITVTPSVTSSTGYITGSTINGTAVTVSASELVSGNLEITENGTFDVTNYKNAVVSASSPSQTKSATYSANGTYTINPDSGYLLSSASVTVGIPTYDGSATIITD